MSKLFSFSLFVLIVVLAAAASVISASKKHQHLSPLQQEEILKQASSTTTQMAAFLGASNNLFTTLNPVVNSILNQEITKVAIPNFNQNSGDVSFGVSDITVTGFSCSNCISLGIESNYVAININDLSVQGHLEYAAEWKKIIHIHAHGHCSPDISSISASAHASFGDPTSAGKPTISVSDLDIHIGHLHLGCSGVVGEIADGLSDIIKAVGMKIVEHILTKVLTNEVNKILGKLQLQKSFDSNFAIANFNIVPSQTFIANSQVQIGVVGVIVPTANPTINFPFSQPTLKNACSGNQVQIGLSSYTFETLFYSYYAANRLFANFNGAIKAGDLEVLIPGFAFKLGKNTFLNLTLAAANAATFTTNETSKSFSVNVPMNLTISGGSYSYVMSATAAASLSVAIVINNSTGAPSIRLQIPALSFLNSVCTFSNVGGRGAGPLVIGVIDLALNKAVIPPINWFLNKAELPLPSLDGFEVYNPEINYQSQGICIALNIKQMS